MVDLLPGETRRWQWVEGSAREHFRRACVDEIRTPLLEQTTLFARGIGETTDVVGKEMYTFEDRGGRSCTLRPEGTASVVRAALEHGLLSQGPQRLWYCGPMFRYERPQAGRQRQFHQIGLEFLGFGDARSDVETIAIAWDWLTALGLKGLTLELNTLGDGDDRGRFRQDLVRFLEAHRQLLDPDSLDRLERNPLRILDSKHPDTQALLERAPTLIQSLSTGSRLRFEEVQSGLAALNIPVHLNPKLVRGLDYYSHTAFEITSDQLGAQSTVCGGGRYDTLVDQLGGPPTPAMGWALGMERLLLLLAHQDFVGSFHDKPDVYLVNRGVRASAAALVLARELRNFGVQVMLDAGAAAFSKQFKRADRSGAAWALVLGDEEFDSGMVVLKSLHHQHPEQQYSLQDIHGLLARLRE